jgi:virginiamycin B lyase
MRGARAHVLAGLLLALTIETSAAAEVNYYPLPLGSGPHDVAPAPDGTVWYSGQRKGLLGRLDPKTGKAEEIPLGPNAMPHGVIVGPDAPPGLRKADRMQSRGSILPARR